MPEALLGGERLTLDATEERARGVHRGGVRSGFACEWQGWQARSWSAVAEEGVVSYDKQRGVYLLFSRVFFEGATEPKRVRINKVPGYGRIKTREEAAQVLTTIRQRAMSRPLFEILAEYMPQPPAEQMVPARWASDFLELKRAECDRGEISKDRLRELEAYPRRGYLAALEAVPVGRLDDPTIARWYDWLRRTFPHLQAPSVRHIVTDLRTFCGHLKRVGALGTIPVFPRVKVPKRARSVPDRESLERILEQIPEAERGLWMARALAGLRPAESRRVDVRDFRAGTLHVRAEIAKTGEDRFLPLADVAPELVAWIERNRASASPWEPLFPAPQGKRRGRAVNVTDGRWRATTERRVWVAALQAAGLEHVAPNLAGRHHFITHEMTVLQTDPLAVRDFAGHASLQTTLGYTHADSRRLARRMRPVEKITPKARNSD